MQFSPDGEWFWDGARWHPAVITSLVGGGVVGVVALGVIIVGIVKLWRWVYWYLVVSFLIAPLGVLQNIATYLVGSGPVQLPGWLLLYSVPFAVIETALGIWMIVLYRRSGTWARNAFQPDDQHAVVGVGVLRDLLADHEHRLGVSGCGRPRGAPGSPRRARWPPAAVLIQAGVAACDTPRGCQWRWWSTLQLRCLSTT